MDELVRMVAARVGIPEAQAEQAVEIVVGFLKDKLPEPIAGQVDAALEGDLSGLDDLIGGLDGLFNN